jgi:hypothetical protein
MDIHIVASPAEEDYPQTWSEFLDRFGTEEACLTYLEKLRWPNGSVRWVCCVFRTILTADSA